MDLFPIESFLVCIRGIKRSHNNRRSATVSYGYVFPTFLPSYFQQIGNVTPMTYAVQTIRNIMIQNAVLGDVLQPMTTLVVSAIILYVVGVLLYRKG